MDTLDIFSCGLPQGICHMSPSLGMKLLALPFLPLSGDSVPEILKPPAITSLVTPLQRQMLDDNRDLLADIQLAHASTSPTGIDVYGRPITLDVIESLGFMLDESPKIEYRWPEIPEYPLVDTRMISRQAILPSIHSPSLQDSSVLNTTVPAKRRKRRGSTISLRQYSKGLTKQNQHSKRRHEVRATSCRRSANCKRGKNVYPQGIDELAEHGAY